MDDFAKGKPAERQAYFEETAARRNSTTTAVEKDFCICWTLKHLFTLESIPELRFKGGTSPHLLLICLRSKEPLSADAVAGILADGYSSHSEAFTAYVRH